MLLDINIFIFIKEFQHCYIKGIPDFWYLLQIDVPPALLFKLVGSCYMDVPAYML